MSNVVLVGVSPVGMLVTLVPATFSQYSRTTPPPVCNTVNFKIAEPVPEAFVALSTTCQSPACVGFPEISPAAFIVSPGGRFAAAKLVGLPLAAIW